METKARMELIIDELPLALGDPLVPEVLNDHNFHKVGLVRRLLTGKSVGRVLYTMDNIPLNCLAEDFTIFPCTHSYLDKDRQWETRVSLFFEDGILDEVLFQVIEGRYAAANFIERFTEICTEILGDPSVPEPDTRHWVNGTTMVTTFLHRDGLHADFRFELKNH